MQATVASRRREQERDEVRRAPEDAVAATIAAQASIPKRTKVTDPAAKPRRGCFFYGCITGLVLLVLVLGALMVGLHYVKKIVNQFTDSQPMDCRRCRWRRVILTS